MKGEKAKQTSTYREVEIEGTIYCVTSVYLGEKDLKTSLEDLIIRRVIAEGMRQ